MDRNHHVHGATPRRILVLAAALVAALLLSTALIRSTLARTASFHGTAYEPAADAPDFRLVDHSGEPVSLASFRGKTVLLFFGYTHCPDVCPLTLAKLRSALASLDGDARDVRILMVTVDPERDTPAVLADYVGRYGPEVSGLTGSREELARVALAYGVHAEAGHGAEHAVVHTPAIFGIDAAGRLRVLIRPDADADALRADVRTLVRG
jgi:protein SCO1/2